MSTIITAVIEYSLQSQEQMNGILFCLTRSFGARCLSFSSTRALSNDDDTGSSHNQKSCLEGRITDQDQVQELLCQVTTFMYRIKPAIKFSVNGHFQRKKGESVLGPKYANLIYSFICLLNIFITFCPRCPGETCQVFTTMNAHNSYYAQNVQQFCYKFKRYFSF